jgi:hypothetical protein
MIRFCILLWKIEFATLFQKHSVKDSISDKILKSMDGLRIIRTNLRVVLILTIPQLCNFASHRTKTEFIYNRFIWRSEKRALSIHLPQNLLFSRNYRFSSLYKNRRLFFAPTADPSFLALAQGTTSTLIRPCSYSRLDLFECCRRIYIFHTRCALGHYGRYA